MKKKGRSRREKKQRQNHLADIVVEKLINAKHSSKHSFDKLTNEQTEKPGEQDDVFHKWTMDRISESLEKTNIFVINESTYNAYLQESITYTTTTQSQEKTIQPPSINNWPFPDMWISFAEGINLTDEQSRIKLSPIISEKQRVKNVKITGQVWSATEEGPLIIEAVEAGIIPIVKMGEGEPDIHLENEPEFVIFWVTVYSPQDGWGNPLDLNPWICNAIHYHLSDFQKIVVERNWKPHQARQLTQNTQDSTTIRPEPPPPYYIIQLQTKVIERDFNQAIKSASSRKKVELQYRFPVRGHYRVKIRRGLLPLPERDIEILAKRRYTIYTTNPLSEEHDQMLVDRGIADKRENEWMAILVSWVNHYEKGPKDKPLIPSIRLA